MKICEAKKMKRGKEKDKKTKEEESERNVYGTLK